MRDRIQENKQDSANPGKKVLNYGHGKVHIKRKRRVELLKKSPTIFVVFRKNKMELGDR